MKRNLALIFIAAIMTLVSPEIISKEISFSSINRETNDSLRRSPDFEVFIKYFLNTVYWGKDMRNLLDKSSPSIKQFIHKKIGFGQFYRIGINFCLSNGLYDHSVGKKVIPKLKKLRFFKEKLPKGEFCSGSHNHDGVYYKTIKEFPYLVDIDGRHIETKLPKKYRKSQNMYVIILNKGEFEERMYFAKVDGIWWYVYIDDSDCDI